ncbi:MAG: glycosyltransferase family 4 protein [Candidatus Spechtbacteria bacterium SB0662_bin_43]|uniref:Glycosyltransferase family 4 protein n=1 Tax=Candidatus Spechtbacteria bacterium SB0662_bin_43 TaxID=2604897 RepID=A0A845D9I3_9BACT|nr:glycosyltransferase family 4 protein [Candidatus Spechtbacteria bacterium SB0662_bin_43]
MNIGIDIRGLEPGLYGGVSEYIRTIVPLLVRYGTEHHFHLFYSSFRKKDVALSLSLEGQDNVTSHFVSYPNKLLFLAERFNRLKVETLINTSFDVFFSPHIIPVSLKKESPHIVLFHDVSFERFPSFFDTKRRLWHTMVAPKRQAHRATYILTPSRATKQDLISLYHIDPDTIEVIPLAAREEPRRRKPLLQSEVSLPQKYILSLCTLEPRKNIVGLIRAFTLIADSEEMRDTHLVIAGGMGWSYGDILREHRDSPVASRIMILGAVSEDMKYELYKNALLFVFPSFYEGFGIPPLEAMNAGVPVISSFSSSLPEVVGDAAILVDPYNIPEIAASMHEVVRDSQLRSELQRASKLRAHLFSWDTVAKNTLAAIERVAEGE